MIYRTIFDEIICQAMNYGMVGGKVLYTDCAHLKANTNKNKFDMVEMVQTPSDCLSELDRQRAEFGFNPCGRAVFTGFT